MDSDNIEMNEGATPPKYYSSITTLVALSIVAVLIYLGVQGFPFWPVVLLAGIVQVIFRVSKRAWLNAFSAEQQTDGSAEVDEGVSDGSAIGIYLALYAVMVLVSALWYGIGSLFQADSGASLLWKWPLELLGLM